MDRWVELEQERRAIAMLAPGAPALDRERALAMYEELKAAYKALRVAEAGG